MSGNSADRDSLVVHWQAHPVDFGDRPGVK